jgi:hypothetical protein
MDDRSEAVKRNRYIIPASPITSGKRSERYAALIFHGGRQRARAAQAQEYPLKKRMRITHRRVRSVANNKTHPFMHRVRTVDYAIVMSGESVVHLKAGDVVVQQATNQCPSQS